MFFLFSSCVGEMQTYWLETGDRSDTMSKGSSHGTGSVSEFDASNHCVFSVINEKFEKDGKHQHKKEMQMKRFVDWNVDVLLRLLKQIVAKRDAGVIVNKTHKEQSWNNNGTDREFYSKKKGNTVLDEVQEIITLPTHDPSVVPEDPESIHLPEMVVHQLVQYINCIASMYKENPCTYDYVTS